MIQYNKCDIIFTNSAIALWASTTGAESANLPICSNIRCIAGGLGNDFINVMFTQKFVDETGITTMEELVARKQPVRLICKKNGAFGELAAEQVFGVFGIDIDNPPPWLTVTKTWGAAIVEGLCSDLYDMTIDHIGAGQANTTELCIFHDMYDVQLGDDAMAQLCLKGYSFTTVPAGTWRGQDVDIRSVGAQKCIIVSADMEDNVAYAITKALCENTDILAYYFANLSFNPEIAGSSSLTGCQLHPGAAAYYRDRGYQYSDPVLPPIESTYSVTLPSSTIEIQDSAFENNMFIQKVVLPEGLAKIGNNAFSGCKNLRTVVFLSNHCTIADDAFRGCDNLTLVCPVEIAVSYAIPHNIPYMVVPQ